VGTWHLLFDFPELIAGIFFEFYHLLQLMLIIRSRRKSATTPSPSSIHLPNTVMQSIESRRPCRGINLLVSDLGDTVRKRELEVWCEELLDIWATDIGGLLDLANLEDL